MHAGCGSSEGLVRKARVDTPAAVSGRRYTRVKAAMIIVFTALTAFLVLRIVIHIRYEQPVNGAEAVMLAHGWRAARGEPVYGPVEKPPFALCVYNPVLPYLCGLTMRIFGPTPLPVRVFALGCCLGSGLILYLFVRRETGSTAAGMVAGFLLLTGRYLFWQAGSATADYPALFFSLAGLYLWRTGGRSRYWAIAAFALAFFTKQTSVAVAAAAFSSLFLEGKKLTSLRLFGVFLLAVGLVLLGCGFLFGRAYFVNAYHYVRIAPFSPASLIRRAGSTAVFFIAPLVAWIPVSIRSFRDKRLLLPTLYAFFSLFTALSSGRHGAGRTYFFDFAAAMSIMAGFLWAGIAARAKAGRITRAVVAAVAVQLVLLVLGTWQGSHLLGVKDPRTLAREATLARIFKDGSGIILCRYLGLEVGGTAQNCASDIFKLHHLIEGGVVPQEVLLEPIRRRKFSLVIMPRVERDWKLFTDDMRKAVEENYTFEHETTAGLFYSPGRPNGT